MIGEGILSSLLSKNGNLLLEYPAYWDRETTPFSINGYIQVPMPVLIWVSKETIFGTIFVIAIIT